jgi:hypothetical protein
MGNFCFSLDAWLLLRLLIVEVLYLALRENKLFPHTDGKFKFHIGLNTLVQHLVYARFDVLYVRKNISIVTKFFFLFLFTY